MPSHFATADWRKKPAWPAFVAVALVLLLLASALTPARMAGAAGIKTHDAMGLDSCAAPSVTQMQTIWSSSAYWDWYIYIGGAARACPQPNLNSNWVTSVRNQGWGLTPIWVGPQAPCASLSPRFSNTPATAWTQGVAEANAAYDRAVSLGITVPPVIVYDLEAFSSTVACLDAVDSFVSAWTWQLHNRNSGTKAGLYGSSCGSHLETLYNRTSPRPDWIWGADWDNIRDASNMACVGASHWSGYKRHKQYRGPHNETLGSVTVNVDSDCAYGPVFANVDRFTGRC